MNQWINDETVNRTAPATPGLFKILNDRFRSNNIVTWGVIKVWISRLENAHSNFSTVKSQESALNFLFGIFKLHFCYDFNFYKNFLEKPYWLLDTFFTRGVHKEFFLYIKKAIFVNISKNLSFINILFWALSVVYFCCCIMWIWVKRLPRSCQQHYLRYLSFSCFLPWFQMLERFFFNYRSIQTTH